MKPPTERFVADWIDAAGKRHRRWYRTQKEATAHQARERAGVLRARAAQLDALAAEAERSDTALRAVLDHPNLAQPEPIRGQAKTALVWGAGEVD